MTLELDRLAPELGRVVVGVVIQDAGPGAEPVRRTFGGVAGKGLRIREGYTDLATGDFAEVEHATAATVAEFVRDGAGGWALDARPRGSTRTRRSSPGSWVPHGADPARGRFREPRGRGGGHSARE